MKIKWYGQACMILESISGRKIMCDPYDESVGYRLSNEDVDIVTVSHDHFDHSAADMVKGEPVVIKKADGFNEKGGAERGDNIVFKFEIDNINFVHMGDIGHVLTDEQVKEIRPCDILAVPVGGVYTVDESGAKEIVNQLNPQIIIPIHYHTPSNKIGLNPVDGFLKNYTEVRREKFWEGTRTDIPERAEVWVLMAHGER